MSATQLLRILQTLPACADHDEICDFNTDELEASVNRDSKCTNPFLSNEVDNNQVNFWTNQPELEGSTFGNEFIVNREDVPSRKPPSLTKSTGFYVDKHSVECELPELIVCYKESDFRVKEICIDEKKHEEETISVHKNNNHEFVHSSGFVNGDDDDDGMIEASVDTEFHKHEWLRSSSMACCYMDDDDDDDDDDAHPTKGSKEKQRKSANEESNPCEAMNPEFIYEHPLDSESIVNQQDLASGYKVVVKNNETIYVEGESSFSMAGVISELISCSRPMPLVGGVSTRSDSSANSTRSFAFPALEIEYASSPVRMGKVERRRLQKQRRWKKGLLCCKF